MAVVPPIGVKYCLPERMLGLGTLECLCFGADCEGGLLMLNFGTLSLGGVFGIPAGIST